MPQSGWVDQAPSLRAKPLATEAPPRVTTASWSRSTAASRCLATT